MNVLVYNGPGTTPGSVKHTVETLRYLLEPHYAVSTVSSKVLLQEPWQTKTSALVFPGGADLPYVKECRPIIPAIKDFISKQGGKFIGFCAGGYFGSSRVEFCQGDLTMEVTGNRDLQFFPGTARGPAFSGFKYKSEAGAKAALLTLSNGAQFHSYYNGGSVFVDADSFDNVEVLAHYAQETDVPYTDNSDNSVKPAAVVLCTVGRGKVLLTGPHPEFIPKVLEKAHDNEFPPHLIDVLKQDDTKRIEFMHHILEKAGFKTRNDYTEYRAPSMTPILVTTRLQTKDRYTELQQNLKNNTECVINSGHLEFSGEADRFQLYQGYESSLAAATAPLDNDDPDKSIKTLIIASDNEIFPSKQVTTNFNFENYFSILKPENTVGSLLLYGEVLTSTSTLLNQNRSLLNSLPDNSVLFVGDVQLSGRGRGGNTWVNPKGVCASTAVISLPLVSPLTHQSTPIAFVQYLAMLAYSKAICSYEPGFEDLPVRIKWPNDLYIMSPDYYYSKNLNLFGSSFDHNQVPLTDIEPAYLKVAGLLINTHVFGDKYTLLLGCGLNLSNNGPTSSLNQWVDILNVERRKNGQHDLPHIEKEKLLAEYMNNLQDIMHIFVNRGVQYLLPDYYKFWLHSNQIVRLTEHANTRAMITGITSDYGLLIAKELEPGSDYRFTGTTFHLQPDGNTFDIFKGLIAKKA